MIYAGRSSVTHQIVESEFRRTSQVDLVGVVFVGQELVKSFFHHRLGIFQLHGYGASLHASAQKKQAGANFALFLCVKICLTRSDRYLAVNVVEALFK